MFLGPLNFPSIAVAIVVGLALMIGSAPVATADGDYRILFAVEVSRHGERTPLSILPACRNITKWPQGLGQLTTSGIQDQFKIGQFIHDRYVVENRLFGPQYDRREIFVHATDVPRILMSAESQLYAIFDGVGILPGGYQPIPIHVRRADNDTLLRAYEFSICPNLEAVYNDRVLKMSDVIEFGRQNQDFMDRMAQLAGLPYLNLTTFDAFYDAVSHSYLLGTPCPANLTDDDFVRMRAIENFAYEKRYANERLRPFIASNLLQFIRDQSRAVLKESGTQPLKFAFFSALDTTIAAVLGALRSYPGDVPPINSTLLFEVLAYNVSEGDHPKPSSFRGRILYNGVNVFNGGFEDYIQFLSGGIADNWDLLCGRNIQSASSFSKPENEWMSIIFGVVAFALAATCIWIIVSVIRHKNAQEQGDNGDEALRSLSLEAPVIPTTQQ